MIQRSWSSAVFGPRRSNDATRRGLILVAGPDGAGKSTLVNRLVALAKADGVAIRHDHYRPGLLLPPPPEAPPVTRPREQVPRGRGISALKLALVFVDTVAGAIGVWRKSRNAGIVVLERGWFDMAVDPRRYRLPDSMTAVVRCLGRFLPRADLAVLLSGDPGEIHSRKPEIGLDEVRRQLDRWRTVAPMAAREIVELDSVGVSADTQAKRLWRALGERGESPGWRRVPLSSRRLDLRVSGQVPRTAWIHRSYRATARLVDPLRPALARVGSREARVEETLEKATELSRLLEFDPCGMLAMRSSTEGRWVIGIAAGDRLMAVLKIGPSKDDRLRSEADVLEALTKVGRPSWAPALLWAGDFEDMFAVLTRAVVRRRRARPSLVEVSELCTRLVRGDPTRPPLVHGDLAPWNVVRSQLGVCAFDWEHAKWDHRPLHDLSHYLVQSGALLHSYTPAHVVGLLTSPGSPGWQHLESCGLDPSTGREMLRGYLGETPEFELGSDHFRAEVARCL